MKRIVLTGGGTAGHVTPCIAMLPALKKKAMIFTISDPIRVSNGNLLKNTIFLTTVFLRVN